MDKHITDMIEYLFDFNIKSEYLFKKLYGLTFVFRKNLVLINDELSSAEIHPLGIIYEENDEFYYAPLHSDYKIEDIVKEYVKKISEEAEYPHF